MRRIRVSLLYVLGSKPERTLFPDFPSPPLLPTLPLSLLSLSLSLSLSLATDDLIRRAAEAHLVQAEETQYGPFLIALCTELASEDRPLNVRQMAGLHIKNLISAKNPAVVLQKEQRWKECDGATKDGARGAFLQALVSPHREVARVAAQIIASYGAVDVPLKQWPSLMDTLCSNVTRADMHETTKVASLEVSLCQAAESPENTQPSPLQNLNYTSPSI